MRKSKAAIHKEKMEVIHKVNKEIVAKGICPNCGTPLERNSAINDGGNVAHILVKISESHSIKIYLNVISSALLNKFFLL